MKKLQIGQSEEKLIKQWNMIIKCAKRTYNYDKELTYGVYQITEELNTYKVIEEGKKKVRVYDYPDLNGNLTTLKALIKEYYLTEIVPILFEYEFLK